MKYDFIEIGTSDFRTLAHTVGIGISVEPVKEYFDRLPERAGLVKLNAAISDSEGDTTMYYNSREKIEEHNLPQWFAGCNSMGKPHQSIVDYLEREGINPDDIIQKQKVKYISISKMFKMFNVTEVDFLKIDTEGHDYVIMMSLFRMKKRPIIKSIKFESNILMKQEEHTEIVEAFAKLGYTHQDVTERGNKDTILTLK